MAATNNIYDEIFGENHNGENDDTNSINYEEDDNDAIENHGVDEDVWVSDEDYIEFDDDDEDEVDEDDAGMIEQGPQSGMEFKTKGGLKRSYQAFAKTKGFSIVVRNCRTNRTSTEYVYLQLACSRCRKTTTQKKTKRTDCPAKLNAVKQATGFWRVTTVLPDHNHELRIIDAPMMPAHKSLSTNMKRQVEANDIAGVPVCKSVKMIQVQAGGPENVGASARDIRNFINKRRRLRLGVGDAEAIRVLFMRLQQKDRSFFYTMDIDDKGRLRNVLWIHPRSRAAYQGDFGDVVSFDTTYLVNTYDMPFATIVGVNHHYQSILLGCALVSHEDIESMKWLWSNWLEAMGGVPPRAMLTDQCGSIRNAVREVMPDTIHRYCVWHIATKAPLKFKRVTEFHRCCREFNSVIYNSRSISEFEERWAAFLVEFGLLNNPWCKELWAERVNWVGVYLNHTFWAGMMSTQRSESMHAYFDGYITARSTLKTFVEQYEIATADKIHKEVLADYESKTKTLRCITSYIWEEQFRNAYTNNVFQLVQKEVYALINCNVSEEESAEVGIENFNVVEKISGNRWCNNKVEYRPMGQYIKCDCRKFESKGILCCHIMKVLVEKDIDRVNDRYVMRRWRKDVYRLHSSIFFAGGYPHMTDEYKSFQRVEERFIECTDLAYECPEKMKHIEKRCEELRRELVAWRIAPRTFSVVGETSAGDGPILQNPTRKKRRGRPIGRVQGDANRTMLANRGLEEEAARPTRGRGGNSRGGGRGRGRGSGANVNIPREDDVFATQESAAP